ncbi:MAG: hypothetical protein ACYTCU_00680 [Planctomycetota bacterium]|jgi:hypothetical protein
MKSFLSACLALLIAVPAVSAFQEPDDAAPAPAGGSGSNLVPFDQNLDAPGIPDIDAHLGERLRYVRRLDDRVIVDLPNLDLERDPVMQIDGRPVSRAEFRRRAVMYAGSNEIDRAITRLLTDRQIKLSVAEGADAASFEADSAFLDTKLEELETMLRVQARGGTELVEGQPDPGDEVVNEWKNSIEASIGWDEYRRLLGADAQFELVFLPMPKEPVEGTPHDMADGPPPIDEERPEWMPQATWDALGHDEQGRNLRSFVKTWAINGEQIPAMFKPSILGKMREGMLKGEGVKFFFDTELPADVLLMVGDETVMVDDIWPLVSGTLSETDTNLIVRELLTLEGMRSALEAAGKWIEQDEFDEIWYQHDQEYAGTLFPLRSIIMFRGYLSLDRYREHYRYRQAYNLWRRETLTEDEVLEHYQRGGRLFFERGNIVVDIAYVPLEDRPFNDASFEETDKLLEAAFAKAQDEWIAAREAAGEGEKIPHWFEAVAAAYEPPVSRQPTDNHNFQRSQLRMRLAESELSMMLTGYSLADDAFYRGQPGEVFGPWGQKCRRHAWGAELNAGSWAVHVKRFTRRSPVGPFSDRNRDMAYEDYLDLNYLWWAQESLKALLPSVKTFR